LGIAAAVVGLGYWGPNLARNISASADLDLIALCDANPERLARMGRVYPAARAFTDLDELLRWRVPELVVVATPVASHQRLASAALRAGAHVLLEKPLAASVREGEQLVELAERHGRRLLVDHTFLFTPAVQEIRRQLAAGALGSLLYVDCVRIALGLFQPDVDVVWDLAPHDLSILQHVLGAQPERIRAIGSSHNPQGLADMAHLHLDYPGSLQAHVHVSWLSPVKIRRMILAGTRQSLIFDDLEPAEKIKLYDYGVSFDAGDPEARREVLISYRKGDMRAPALASTEALAAEVKHVAAVLRGEEEPVAPGMAGVSVLRILEAASRSLREDGEAVAP
jgi:predicted dehydrogenase